MKLALIAMFFLGLAFGFCIVCLIRVLCGVSGTLKIDRNDPEKDVYRLEIDNLDSLPKKKCVILKVDAKADLSQK